MVAGTVGSSQRVWAEASSISPGLLPSANTVRIRAPLADGVNQAETAVSLGNGLQCLPLAGTDPVHVLKVPQLGEKWLKPGDPAYDEFLKSEYSDALQILSADNTEVAWLVSPHLNRTRPYNDPARLDQINTIILPMLRALPNSDIIDYQAWIETTGEAKDKATRNDGVHIRADALPTVMDWLVPQLIDGHRANNPVPS